MASISLEPLMEGILICRKPSIRQDGRSIFLEDGSTTTTYVLFLFERGLGLTFPTYSQTETKESKWDMPDELLLLLEKVEKEGKAAPQPASALVYAHTPSCCPSVAH